MEDEKAATELARMHDKARLMEFEVFKIYTTRKRKRKLILYLGLLQKDNTFEMFLFSLCEWLSNGINKSIRVKR